MKVEQHSKGRKVREMKRGGTERKAPLNTGQVQQIMKNENPPTTAYDDRRTRVPSRQSEITNTGEPRAMAAARFANQSAKDRHEKGGGNG